MIKLKFLTLTLFVFIAVSFFFAGSVVAEENTITFGSEYVFNPAETDHLSVASLSSNKFVVAYRDVGASGYGRAVVGAVADNAVVYGQEYVFNTGQTTYIAVSSLSENKFVVVYRDGGNSDYGAAVVGTVSGDVITYGQSYVFNTSAAKYINIDKLDSNTIAVAYQDCANSNYGKVVIGSVSGDDVVTFGSEYVFNPAETDHLSVASLSSNKFVVAYRDVGASGYGRAVVGVVADNAVVYGQEYVFNSADTIYIDVSFMAENKFNINYKDIGNLNYGSAIVGTVADNIITYGQEYVFNTGISDYISASSFSENKFVVSYKNDSEQDYGTSVIGQISGEDISYSREYVFNSGQTNTTTIAVLSVNKFVVVYQDGSESNYGTAIIGSLPQEAAEETIKEETEEETTGEETAEEEKNQESSEESSGIIELNDGDLIKNPNAQGDAQFDIYIIKIVGDKKFKRLIISPHVFESYNHFDKNGDGDNGWNDVVEVNQATMGVYTTSDLVRKVDGEKVYRLTATGDTGTKRWLNMSAASFKSGGYDWDSIYLVNPTDIEAYTTGVPLI